MIKQILVAFLVLAGVNANAGPMFIDQGTTVTFDKSNYLVFEDVGRITYKAEEGQPQGMTAGKFVRLHVCRDGKQYNVDVVDRAYDENDWVQYPLVPTQVKEIKYKDKDNVWIVARQGHRGDTTVLFNIADRGMVASLGGQRFKVSSDGSQVAFYYTYGHDDDRVAVFVNDVMVFPFVSRTIWKRGYQPMLPDGRELDDYAKKENPPKSKPDSDLEWLADNGLQFSVTENFDTPDKKQVINCAISGLSGDDLSSNTQKIKVEKTVINLQTDVPVK